MLLFSKKSPLTSKKNFTKKRSLRMEALEDRQMLSINAPAGVDFDVAAFNQVAAQYSSLNFAVKADFDAYDSEGINNIYVVDVVHSEGGGTHLIAPDGNALSDNDLQQMVAGLNKTDNSVIVFRVSDNDDHTFDLGYQIDATGFINNLSIVVWNDNDSTGSLIFDAVDYNASGMSGRHLSISGSKVEVGGLKLDASEQAALGGIGILANSTVRLDSVTIENCFSGNWSSGGAIQIGGSTLDIYNSQFLNNSAGNGGAIGYINAASTVTVSNSIFEGNSTIGNGGAVFQSMGTFNAYNTLFAGNSAAYGGAIYTTGNGSATTLVNATVAGNTSSNTSTNNNGAVFNNSGFAGTNPVMRIYNSVFTGNSNNRDVYWAQNGLTRIIANTIRSYGTTGQLDGSFNTVGASQPANDNFNEVNADPGLDAGNGYRPTFKSAVINKIADPEQYLAGALTGKDLDGNARVFGDKMDVGAYEFPYSNSYHVEDVLITFDVVKDKADSFVVNNGDIDWTYTIDVRQFIDIDAFGIAVPEDLSLTTDTPFINNGDGTITFTGRVGFSETFTFSAIVNGLTTNTATVTVQIINTSSMPFEDCIVNTLVDLGGDQTPGLLSLRQAIENVNLAYAGGSVNNAVFFDYAALLAETQDQNYAYDAGNFVIDVSPNYGEMTVDSNVNIYFNYRDACLTIDAHGQSRIFTVVDGRVGMSDLALTGGYMDSVTEGYMDTSGGGIFQIDGDLTLNNILFQNNEARAGGGFAQFGGVSTVVDCLFTENNAAIGAGMFVGGDSVATVKDSRFEYGNVINGGGIYQKDGDLTIENVAFEHNTARTSGGAFYQIGGTSAITAWFSDNMATYGGAVYVGQSADATLQGNTRMTDNSAKYGAGIFQSDGTLHILGENVLIYENVASYRGEVAASVRGGAIYLKDGNLIIVSATFENNTAINGGGICQMDGVLEVENVVFKNNSATNAGGGFYQIGGTSTFWDADFSENTAVYGGAFYLGDSSDASIQGNSRLSDNSSKYGGGIFVSDGTLNVAGENVIIIDNTASLKGGGLYLKNGNVTVANSTFENNSAANGGGICQIDGTLTINSTSLNDNTATNSGGGVYQTGGEATINGTAFFDNKAVNGAGYYLGVEAAADIQASFFHQNTATYGAGIFLSGTTKTQLAVVDSLFDGNTADKKGGGIYLKCSEANASADANVEVATVQAPVFLNNSASKGGGAAIAKALDVELTLAFPSKTEVFESAIAKYLDDADIDALFP